MPNVIGVGIGHEQADPIAREPACLRRLASYELVGEHEIERVDGSGRGASFVLQAKR